MRQNRLQITDLLVTGLLGAALAFGLGRLLQALCVLALTLAAILALLSFMARRNTRP